MLVKINHQAHPTNSMYEVFSYPQREHADHFISQLNQAGISYEKDEDETIYYVATHVSYSKTVRRFNYITMGEFRTPWVEDKGVRWLIVLLPVLLLLLAVIGWVVAK